MRKRGKGRWRERWLCEEEPYEKIRKSRKQRTVYNKTVMINIITLKKNSMIVS